MSVPISLVALALGYFVFTGASKEKEGLKILGQVIGLVVMIGAVLSLVCASMKCLSGGGCPFKSKGMCSFKMKSSSTDASSQVGIPQT